MDGVSDMNNTGLRVPRPGALQPRNNTKTNTITNKDETTDTNTNGDGNTIAIYEILERKSLYVLLEAKSMMASYKYKYKER